MKRNKNILLAVVLLVFVLIMGVGYAISTQSLTVNGTATAQESGSSFNVKFTNAVKGTDLKDGETTLATSTASVTSDYVATMTATLTNVGNSQTATFTITNASQAGISAKIIKDNVKIYKKGTTENFVSEYFDVTTNIVSDITIPAVTNNTATFTVTVSLKKAYVGSGSTTSVSEEFDIVLSDIQAVQA